jgi:hypothetical protein
MDFGIDSSCCFLVCFLSEVSLGFATLFLLVFLVFI